MRIQKLYNDTDTLVEEAMLGNQLLFPGCCEIIPDTHFIVRRTEFRKPEGLVKMAFGGGAGHEGPGPHNVGPGGYDLMITGDIFTAPSGARVFQALSAIDDGSPIFLGVTNHTGDILNSKLALQMCRQKGMDVHMHVIYDDVASAPKGQEAQRRAILHCYDVAPMMAEHGEPIEEILRVAAKSNQYTRSYGVGLRKAIHPVTGLPIMEIPEGEIELGIGVHGESSGNRIKLPTSRELAAIVCDVLLEDMPVERGEEIAVCLRGLGGMTWMELYILYKDLYEFLTGRGIRIARATAGNSGTQELGGFIFSIARLDDEIKKWMNVSLPARYNL